MSESRSPVAGPEREVRATRALAALALTLAALMLLSLAVGAGAIGLGGARGEAARLIVLEIRLPRTLAGMLVGAALGVSGAALQGYLRNPLAEPGVVGISAGAALGAVLAIHTGLAATTGLALPMGGLIGALAATIALLRLAGPGQGAIGLVLAGVAVASVATALTSLALNLSSNPFASVEMVFWLMGSLADRSFIHVTLAAPLIVAGAAALLVTGRSLDALTLGEDAAASLGTDLVRLRRLVVWGTALAVGAATAMAGTIGFVGLMVPHLLRPLVGHRPGLLLPASLVGGACLVLAADIALRLVETRVGLRLGVLTALVGAPFFLWLVVRTRRELAP